MCGAVLCANSVEQWDATTNRCELLCFVEQGLQRSEQLRQYTSDANSRKKNAAPLYRSAPHVDPLVLHFDRDVYVPGFVHAHFVTRCCLLCYIFLAYARAVVGYLLNEMPNRTVILFSNMDNIRYTTRLFSHATVCRVFCSVSQPFFSTMVTSFAISSSYLLCSQYKTKKSRARSAMWNHV